MAPATNPPPLESLQGRSVSAPQPTLVFESGRAFGSDGCNRFSALFTAKGSSIEIGPRGISTQMACAPDVMKQAEAMTAALNATQSYRVAGGQLQLLGADGAVLAAFSAQSRLLAGTSWEVTGINNRRNAVVSVQTGSKVTLTFGSDGSANGSAGCNAFTTRYQADGAKFRFSPPASTRRMCADDGVMQQEQQFLRALEAVATMRIGGDRLEFRDTGGAMQVTARRQ